MPNGYIDSPKGMVNLRKKTVQALDGTNGTPSSVNKFVTNEDTRLTPATSIKDGIMTKEDKTLLHGLAEPTPQTIAELDIFYLANLGNTILQDEEASPLSSSLVSKYLILETFQDGATPIGSITTNMSRNANALTLGIDPNSTNITVVENCDNINDINKYSTGFSSDMEITQVTNWLNGGNAVQLYLDTTDYFRNYILWKDYSASNVRGMVVSTKVNTLDAMLICGWDYNTTSRQRRRYIQPNLYYEDYYIPFEGSQSMQQMAVGLYVDTGNNPCTAVFDNIRICRNTDPKLYASGRYESPVYAYDTDINKILMFDKRYFFHPSCGTIQLDISLDGGVNWKTGITNINVILASTAGGILENPDTGSWASKRELKLRYTFTRGIFTDPSPFHSPQLGGYGVVVKTELE